jgi:hypothetical protein
VRPGHVLALVSVAFAGAAASLLLFRLYRARSGTSMPQRPGRVAERWEFSPGIDTCFSYVPLVLASLLTLYLEFLLIRWISSEIRIFAYLKNFVLIACFLGFGLGCYLSRRPVTIAPLVVPLILLAALVKLPWQALREVVRDLPLYLGASTEVHVWGVPRVALEWSSLPGFLGAILITVCLFSLLAMIFIPLGQLVGWHLENARRGLLGYSINVLASLAGIALYWFLCALYLPPAAWFTVAGALLIALLGTLRRLRWEAVLGIGICLVLIALRDVRAGDERDLVPARHRPVPPLRRVASRLLPGRAHRVERLQPPLPLLPGAVFGPGPGGRHRERRGGGPAQRRGARGWGSGPC